MGTFSQLVRGMVAAGCTPEQIAIAVEAVEEGKAAKGRDANRKRVAAFRERQRNGCNDGNGITCVTSVTPEGGNAGNGVTDVTSESPCLPLKQKERSPPTPPSKEKLNSPSIPSSLRSESVDFEKFWAAYPSKNGKKPARAAFVRATGKLSASELTEKAAAYGAAKAAAGDEFILHATTWLNQERWNDPLPEPRRTAKSGTPADLMRRWEAKIAEEANRHGASPEVVPVDPVDPFSRPSNIEFLPPPRDLRERDRGGGWPDDHQPQTGSRARRTGGS